MGVASLRVPVLVVLLGVVAACGSPPAAPVDDGLGGEGDGQQVELTDPSDAAVEGGSGGTVRVGWGGSPDSLNPGNGVLEEAYVAYDMVYDTLISLDLSGEFQPDLAERWTVSDDGTTWTVELVDGATFSDGEPVTADDVVYSLETYRDTADFPYLSTYPDVFTDITAVDDSTVEITTETPIGNFEARLVFAFIIPEHVWSAEDDVVEFDNADMIGSGPFTLEDHRQGEYITFATREDYWKEPAHVDQVIFQTIENSDARVQALANGDIDVIYEMPKTAIPVLERNENVEVVSGEPLSPELRDVIFNMIDPQDCPDDAKCTGHPALRDLEVRQALSKAVDKQQIIDVAQLGYASPGLTLIPRGLGPWYADGVEDYAFDLDAARQQLEAAGYTDSDGDGVRECLPDQDCDDLTLRFNFANDIDPAPREVELISGWWREIGVATDVQGLDPDTLTSVCCPGFDHDVFLWGWVSDPDPGYLLRAAVCSEIETGFSETGYCNPEYDDLYAEQARETDPAAREEMIHELQRMLVEDAALIVPYYAQTVQAYRTDTFTGWQTDQPRLALGDTTSLTVVRPVE